MSGSACGASYSTREVRGCAQVRRLLLTAVGLAGFGTRAAGRTAGSELAAPARGIRRLLHLHVERLLRRAHGDEVAHAVVHRDYLRVRGERARGGAVEAWASTAHRLAHVRRSALHYGHGAARMRPSSSQRDRASSPARVKHTAALRGRVQAEVGLLAPESSPKRGLLGFPSASTRSLSPTAIAWQQPRPRSTMAARLSARPHARSAARAVAARRASNLR